MSRFMLFSGLTYYPDGGWDDYRDSFENVPDAIEAGKACIVEMSAPDDPWFHVVDTETGRVVFRAYNDYSKGYQEEGDG